MSKTKVMIAGFGQIGQSIYNLYDTDKYEIGHIDLNNSCDLEPPVDVLHVCFGYSEKFIEQVKSYISFFSPKVTIINSTVPYLTTDTIYKNTRVNIVHSPCMGVHPNLTESIKTFEKIVGGCTKEATELACNHFNELGIKTVAVNSSEESEFAKILDTTYYGICIRYMQDIHRRCEDYDLDFDDIYTLTNNIYNTGYEKMNMPYVRRPVLKYMGDGIGGHCIWENAHFLKDDKILKKYAKLILEEGKSQ